MEPFNNSATQLGASATHAEPAPSFCSGASELLIGHGEFGKVDMARDLMRIANVRVWRVALDAATLGTVYLSTFAPSALPCDLISVWPLKQAVDGDATQEALIDVRQRFRLTEVYVRGIYGEPSCPKPQDKSNCTKCPWPAIISSDSVELSLYTGPYLWHTTTGCAEYGGAITPAPMTPLSPPSTDCVRPAAAIPTDYSASSRVAGDAASSTKGGTDSFVLYVAIGVAACVLLCVLLAALVCGAILLSHRRRRPRSSMISGHALPARASSRTSLRRSRTSRSRIFNPVYES